MTAPPGLNAASLGRLSLPPPRYDRRALSPGIVHLGPGGFHRAHAARYLHDLLELDPAAREWSLVGVGLMPGDEPLLAAMRRQDGLYTLVERDDREDSATLIGSISDVVHRSQGAAAVLGAIDRARIVSLTVTGNGYGLNPASRRLDFENPAIARDLQSPHQPRSVIGVIVEGLARRREQRRTAFTALSCDNIQGNGGVLRRAVLDFAEARDAGLARWIEAEGRFPATMVDRITPALAAGQADGLAARLGYRDDCPVFCEPFRQWVIEERFADGRPDWERVGVEMVADVRPYELMKLRLLNASHLALAGPGRLMGFTLVDAAMRDERMGRYLRALMDHETGPTLAPMPGTDLAAYKAQVLRRFANPTIKDTLDRINADAPLNYLLDPLRDRLKAGAPIERLALAVAAWIRRLGGIDDAGGAIALSHPLSDLLRREAARGGPDPGPVLAIAPLFGELGNMDSFVEPVGRWLGQLYAVGASETLNRACALSDRAVGPGER